jgi:hypothetical protein
MINGENRGKPPEHLEMTVQIDHGLFWPVMKELGREGAETVGGSEVPESKNSGHRTNPWNASFSRNLA